MPDIPRVIHIFHPVFFETWGPETPDKRGIGQSETAQIELSWRLAARGWDVWCYAPLDDDSPREWRGVHWRTLDEADFSRDGYWLIWRSPEALDHFPDPHPGKKLYLVSQDESYGGRWNDERCAKLDCMFALCQDHRNSLESDLKLLKGKVKVAANGIRLDLIEAAELEVKRGARRYCFDWGGSLSSNESLREHARKVFAAGHEVYLVPALGRQYWEQADYAANMRSINVPFTGIYRVDDTAPEETAARKVEVLKRLSASAFYDDVEANVSAARKAGFYTCQVFPDTVIQEEIPPVAIQRNPHRIMWASSPDRGLLELLKIFRRVREWVHDAELVITYGFDNIDKLIAKGQEFAYFKNIKQELLDESKQPGVTWMGRIPQPQLMLEWFKTGLIVYPSLFRETFGATYCEAQACGAIPIASPVWANGEHTDVAGSLIVGDPKDPLTQARFVAEIFRWMRDLNLQAKVRQDVMSYARSRWNWERSVDLYESLLLDFPGNGLKHTQFCFQLKHSMNSGSVLNVGCKDDPADHKAMGAVNLDLCEIEPITGLPNKVDIIGDVRDLPGPLNGTRFDTVNCGDMLEHFPPEDVPEVLKRMAACLNPGGKLVLTIPDDDRPVDQQHAASDGSHHYDEASRLCACHNHRIPREMIERWLDEADLTADTIQEIDYYFCKGHGVVCRPKEEGDAVHANTNPAHS